MITALYVACSITGLIRLLSALDERNQPRANFDVAINMFSMFLLTLGGFGLVVTIIELF